MRLISGLLAVVGLGEITAALPPGNPAGTSEVAEVTSVETPAASLRTVEGYGRLPLDFFMRWRGATAIHCRTWRFCWSPYS